MQINSGNDPRHTHDKVYQRPLLNVLLVLKTDITNLKSTIDVRFGKLEKTVEKIHNEFRLKLFDGIDDNGSKISNKPDESLELDFGKEKDGLPSNHYPRKTPNDVCFQFQFLFSMHIILLIFSFIFSLLFRMILFSFYVFLYFLGKLTKEGATRDIKPNSKS